MSGKRIVVALGGNAILTDDPSEKGQREAIKSTCDKLINLIEEGNELIISHGNGPQVGNLLLQQEAINDEKNPAMPLDTCVAMTQGSIGYWLQNEMSNKLYERGINKKAISLITQVSVDENDSAFKNPTKPIGPFLTKEEAEIAAEKDNSVYIEDSGRGYRKVVPSPKPVGIVEYESIIKLLENDNIIISCGGGGVPVIEKENGYIGVEAVIDKDLASEKLAELVDADRLIILTGVDNVYVNFNKLNQEKLTSVTVSKLREYIKEGQFPKGSMLPKIEAAIEFVENSNNGLAVITSLDKLGEINKGEGTIITRD
ncbi:carbamate kinase [Clostridium sp. Sa3CUN1]|uniref:Carbamate kinase n=1 Tax=Clostridium gallinarum TaxID=2762246 RepID=A0ABR8Q2I3_9CLOT|nr:carbamate kinase [Clostridium gallinarum]MBD7914609.1 carbamate kinase [Clostridium gallinarum]